tara:strand:- start:2865 stop:3068 length:204 start_codon:yes stop_codon:yes gene_type:complete
MVHSDFFGMSFWLDDNNDLMYCPTFKGNKPDLDNSGYVCEWDDWEGVDFNELFAIVSKLVTLQQLAA